VKFSIVAGSCLMAAIALPTIVNAQAAPQSAPMDTVSHLNNYQAIEFRRYVTKEGERAHFIAYFDSYFPEAMQQLGAVVFGQFADRGHPTHFTWLRGFHDMAARAVVNASFYYGPVWREHRTKVNAILPDSDNVMLMRPLHANQDVTVLPAVDPVLEPNRAGGVVVAQIFPVKKGSEDAFAAKAEAAFKRYAIDGVHPAGILVTLDAPNSFPQLPIRSDGPWLVWLGVVRDDATLSKHLAPQLDQVERELSATGLTRAPVERLVMDPTPRSRLRWLDVTH
jgi:NIPSNAP protein